MSVELNAHLLGRTEVTPGLTILRVAPDGWRLPDFAAGQFAVLGLPYRAPRSELAVPEQRGIDRDKLSKRAYSIASSPRVKGYFEFYISLVPFGALTPRLFALKVEDRLWLGRKISGMFTLKSVPEERHVVLIGTGTGVAPYMSMLRTNVMGGDRRIALLHGARHSWELAYSNELGMLADRCPTFTYIPIVSRPEAEKVPWAGETGHVQDVWRRQPLVTQWGAQPTASDTHVFLCGNPAMIEGMVTVLTGDGFAPDSKQLPGQIHVEKFW